MSDDQAKLLVRFSATDTSSMALVHYKNVVMTIRVVRTGDPVEDMQNLRTTVANLPEVLQRGSQEFWVQDQVRQLDHEIEEFFRDQEPDEGKGSE